jgi:predicted metalloprotease with PDZ domain
MLKTATKKGAAQQKPKTASATKKNIASTEKPNKRTQTTPTEPPTQHMPFPSPGTVLNLSRQNSKETFGFKATDGAPGDKVFVRMVAHDGIADMAGLKVGMQIVISANGTVVKFAKKKQTNLGSIISNQLFLTLVLVSPNDTPPARLSFYHCTMHGTELPDWEPWIREELP